MFFNHVLSGLIIYVVAVAALQQPLSIFGGGRRPEVKGKIDVGRPLEFDPFDASLFTPVETLSVLSTEQFTTLAHPAFPKHSVRIKKSDWCDGSVRYVTPLSKLVHALAN